MPEPEDRTPSQQFGAQLQEAREARGISRRAMAEKLQMSDVSLLHYEHGTANPTLSKAREIAALYDLDVDIVTKPLQS
jgi:transcriptional regulator with XRE-family HTH domain